MPTPESFFVESIPVVESIPGSPINNKPRRQNTTPKMMSNSGSKERILKEPGTACHKSPPPETTFEGETSSEEGDSLALVHNRVGAEVPTARGASETIRIVISTPSYKSAPTGYNYPAIAWNIFPGFVALLVGLEFALLAAKNSEIPAVQAGFAVTSLTVNAVGTLLSLQDAKRLLKEFRGQYKNPAVSARMAISTALMLLTVVTSVPLADDATRGLFDKWFQDPAVRRLFEVAGIFVWCAGYTTPTRLTGASTILELAGKLLPRRRTREEYHLLAQLAEQLEQNPSACPQGFAAVGDEFISACIAALLEAKSAAVLTPRSPVQRVLPKLLTATALMMVLGCVPQMPILMDVSKRGWGKLSVNSFLADIAASLSTLMFFMRASWLFLERMVNAPKSIRNSHNAPAAMVALVCTLVVAWGSSASWGFEASDFVNPPNGTKASPYLDYLPSDTRGGYPAYMEFYAGVANGGFILALMISVMALQKTHAVSVPKAILEKIFPGFLPAVEKTDAEENLKKMVSKLKAGQHELTDDFDFSDLKSLLSPPPTEESCFVRAARAAKGLFQPREHITSASPLLGDPDTSRAAFGSIN